MDNFSRVEKETSGYATWFTAASKPLKIQVFRGHPAPTGRTAPIFYGTQLDPGI